MVRSLTVLMVLVFCSRCAAQNLSSLPSDLRTVSTDHYILHTDLDNDLTTDLGHRMDVMWDEYARRLCEFAPPQNDRKLEAYLFARRSDYVHLTGERFRNTGGIFVPSLHLLAAFLELQGRDGLRRTLQHEAFHQFAQAAIGGDIPVWLNEGIAQIFEEGIWNGKTFLIGQVPPARIRLLQADIQANKLTDFSSFINRTDAQWSSNLRYTPIAQTQYNQAWAMAQFLIYATDEEGRPIYRQRLIDMLSLIHNGSSGRRAFEDCFSDNTIGFQHLFNEWAHNLSPTAEASYTEHQAVLASMLISLGARGQQFADIASFRRCLADGGYRLRSEGTGDLLPVSFFCDLSGHPLGPEQLFFAAAPGCAAPDIVCHPASDLKLRTHFLRDGAGMLDYETVVQSE
jgi:hypothetical protein